MSNDDLGQFPTPTSANSADTNPEPTPTPIADLPADTFEPTPDEIPSFVSPQADLPSPETFPDTNPSPTPPTIVEPIQELPATIVPKGGSSFGPVILIGLLLVAGIGLAASVFLFSQSQQLRNQLTEITQTLENQRTVITPTPSTSEEVEAITPSVTPTISPAATVSGIITPTATPTAAPTPTTSSILAPLSLASTALRVAINHEPNAQLILIKIDNATDTANSITKYYFRQNLTTKKYFYVAIDSRGESRVVSNSIYVTPDNNIPSLNDMVLGNTLGIDLDQALKIATDLCPGTTCTTATVKAQYIKSGDVVIWQLIFDPQDTAKENLVIQINAKTKEVLYKSPGFK